LVSGTYRVMKWTPNTLTAISDPTSFGSNNIGINSPGPIVFDGGIYVIAGSGGIDSVYKYDGSGVAWTSVHAAGQQLYHIFMTYTHIVVLGLDYVAYSADGTAWSVGSYSAAGESTLSDPRNLSGLNHPLGNFATRSSKDNFFDILVLNTKLQLFSWNGVGSMAQIALYECSRPNTSSSFVCTGDDWINEYSLSDVLHWYSPSSGQFAWSAVLNGTYTTPTNDTVSPKRSHNMLRSVGSKGTVTLHLLEASGQWDAGELVDTLAAGSAISFVTMNPLTGDAYIVTRTTTTNVKIYARDEPYDVQVIVPDAATLYYGVNSIPSSVPIVVT
jgi:hypothetical protein